MTSQVKEHLKEMLATLAAVKGQPYANTCLAFFAVGNHFEALINVGNYSDDAKQKIANDTSDATTMLGFCVLYYEIRRRHPDFDNFSEEKKTEEGKTIAEEFGRDLEMLQNKQREFMG